MLLLLRLLPLYDTLSIHYIQINRVELGLKPSSEHREFLSRSTTPDLLSTSSEFIIGMGRLWQDGLGRHGMAQIGLVRDMWNGHGSWKFDIRHSIIAKLDRPIARAHTDRTDNINTVDVGIANESRRQRRSLETRDGSGECLA